MLEAVGAGPSRGSSDWLGPDRKPAQRLPACLQMAGSWSWRARFSVLTYLQIAVFYNLFTLLGLPGQVLRVRALVLRLLLDEQLEVGGPLRKPGRALRRADLCLLPAGEGHGGDHPERPAAVLLPASGRAAAGAAAGAEPHAPPQGQSRSLLR